MEEKNFLIQEIESQFELWEDLVGDAPSLEAALEEHLSDREYDEVLFFGSGSHFHLAQSAAAVLRKATTRRAVACPASEIMLYPDYWLCRSNKYLAIAISRDGSEPEILGAVEALRARFRTRLISITCGKASPLGKISDLDLCVENCREKSSISTQSFTGMLLLSHLVTAMLGRRTHFLTMLENLVQTARAAYAAQKDSAARVGESIRVDNMYFLGGGPFQGLAAEACILMERLAGVRAQAFTPFEFGYGSLEHVNQTATAVHFLSNSARSYEARLLADLKNLGVRIVLLADAAENEVRQSARDIFAAGRDLPEEFRGLVHLPLLQLMTVRAAERRGRPVESFLQPTA